MEWQPIETAPEYDRVWVCGWQPRSGFVRGYWWFHEDVICEGVPFEHGNATHWCPIILPPFPPPPEGGA